ncbi:MAG: bacillithiol biosynthesis cysteine-adding enzyme BshC [Gemmatimonadales bacterium]|nr:MAG: bacillithiol biosynthesis cysteine-adding enzyme BshC [Gemmatimonadales bacterium]
MKIQPVPLRGSALVNDWLAGHPTAEAFFPGAPGDPHRVRTVAEEVAARFDREARVRAASLLTGGGESGGERLHRFIEEGGFVVTTGQQPALLGGPLYVLFKAFTAVALADRLEELLGRPVLPVFWVGSDDHDWDEARRTWILDPENEPVELNLPPRDGPSPAIHRIPLEGSAAMAGVLEALATALPESDFAPHWRAMIQECWGRPGVTMADGFAAQLERLTADAGLFLTRSHDPELRSAARPLLRAELRSAAASEAELRARAQALEAAGYAVQVPIADGATNVFLDGPVSRDRILWQADGALNLRGHQARLSEGDLSGNGDAALTPNVLLRPVVEAHVFPTLAYVAGPGEAAYLAQNEPLFRRHGVTRPLVHPRFSGVVMERKVEKVIRKYDLELAALALPHHELAGRLARDDLPEGIRRELGRFRGALARHTTELGREVTELDPTLRDSVEQLRTQGFAGLADVEKKVVQALKRENEIMLAQIAKAQLHLFPEGVPQERRMNVWYFLFRYGDAFLAEIRRRAEASLEPLQSGTPVG